MLHTSKNINIHNMHIAAVVRMLFFEKLLLCNEVFETKIEFKKIMMRKAIEFYESPLHMCHLSCSCNWTPCPTILISGGSACNANTIIPTHAMIIVILARRHSSFQFSHLQKGYKDNEFLTPHFRFQIE